MKSTFLYIHMVHTFAITDTPQISILLYVLKLSILRGRNAIGFGLTIHVLDVIITSNVNKESKYKKPSVTTIQQFFMFIGFICTFVFIDSLLCISTSKCMLAHAFAWLKMIKNIQKSWKKYISHQTHKRLMKKNKEKSFLVSDWEWLPKTGCSFGIFVFFLLFRK